MDNIRSPKIIANGHLSNIMDDVRLSTKPIDRVRKLSNATDYARKRTVKACDRCRIKKSRCNGESPCPKCKDRDTLCQYTDRKQYNHRAVPKGYIEFLEEQQMNLTAALREMYRRMHVAAHCFAPGLPELSPEVSIHDIMASLGMTDRLPTQTKLALSMSCTNCGHVAGVNTSSEYGRDDGSRSDSGSRTSDGTGSTANSSPMANKNPAPDIDTPVAMTPAIMTEAEPNYSFAFALDTFDWPGSYEGQSFEPYSLQQRRMAGQVQLAPFSPDIRSGPTSQQALPSQMVY